MSLEQVKDFYQRLAIQDLNEIADMISLRVEHN